MASWHFELAAVAGERRLTNVVQRYSIAVAGLSA